MDKDYGKVNDDSSDALDRDVWNAALSKIRTSPNVE